MNARPKAWLHQADNDLALAQLARDNNFLAQACYDASQAAEKALKGALLEHGAKPPSDLFDPSDADQALSTTRHVLTLVETLD